MRETLAIPDRSLWQLSWPILFELLMLYMIPAVDAYYLSRISTEAVAGVSAILPLTGLGNILFMPMTQAASSVSAQHLGAGRAEMAKMTFSLLLGIQFCAGLAMSLFLMTCASWLPGVIGLRGSLAEIASIYMTTIGIGYVFLALKVGNSGVLNALGRTQVNMWSAVLMNLVNLGLNHLLVTGIWGLPKFGPAGVAFASVTAWFSAFLLGWFACRHEFLSPRVMRHQMAAMISNLKHILRIGLPSALEPLSYQLSQVVISKILVHLGVVALTTKVFVGNITLFSLLWSAAFAGGTQIKIAHLLGSRKLDKATDQLLAGVKLVLLGCSALSLVLALSGPWLLGLFTNDPEIIRLGSILLWIAVILEWGRALNVLVGSALRASGDAKFIAFFGLGSMWCIAVGGAYGLSIGLGWGLIGVWLAMTLDEHIRGWVSLYRWRRGYWQEQTVYR